MTIFLVIDTSGSMSSNFPKVVTILDKVGQIYRFYRYNIVNKALETNQKQYSSSSKNTSFLKYKHVVIIPVGANGNYNSCPNVGDYGDVCG